MFSVYLCDHDSVETYDEGRCFTTGGAYENELCRIRVTRPCKLNVNSFSLEGIEALRHASTSWTGTNGPENWMDLHDGFIFFFQSDSSVSSGGLDICCTEETYELKGGWYDGKGDVYLNGQPICHSGWSTEDADVVCRNLGYDYGDATCCAQFDTFDDNFIIHSVDCEGDEPSIWACEYSEFSFDSIGGCHDYAQAGVECFMEPEEPEEPEEQDAIVGVIVFLFLLCGCCVMAWCCCRTFVKKKEKQNQMRIEMQNAGNQNEGIVRNNVWATSAPSVAASNMVVANPAPSVATSNFVSDREGVASTNVAVVRPAHESNQPNRTNAFNGYNRYSDNNYGQVEGSGQNGSVAQTNYGEPEYDPQATSDPPPPAWAPPPAYAPPADGTAPPNYY